MESIFKFSNSTPPSEMAYSDFQRVYMQRLKVKYIFLSKSQLQAKVKNLWEHHQGKKKVNHSGDLPGKENVTVHSKQKNHNFHSKNNGGFKIQKLERNEQTLEVKKRAFVSHDGKLLIRNSKRLKYEHTLKDETQPQMFKMQNKCKMDNGQSVIFGKRVLKIIEITDSLKFLDDKRCKINNMVNNVCKPSLLKNEKNYLLHGNFNHQMLHNSNHIFKSSNNLNIIVRGSDFSLPKKFGNNTDCISSGGNLRDGCEIDFNGENNIKIDIKVANSDFDEFSNDMNLSETRNNTSYFDGTHSDVNASDTKESENNDNVDDDGHEKVIKFKAFDFKNGFNDEKVNKSKNYLDKWMEISNYMDEFSEISNDECSIINHKLDEAKKNTTDDVCKQNFKTIDSDDIVRCNKIINIKTKNREAAVDEFNGTNPFEIEILGNKINVCNEIKNNNKNNGLNNHGEECKDNDTGFLTDMFSCKKKKTNAGYNTGRSLVCGAKDSSLSFSSMFEEDTDNDIFQI